MKKLAICALVLLATSSVAYAGGGMGLGVRGVAAFPMGDFGDFAGGGFGGGACFFYSFCPTMGVGVGVDYVMFGETEITEGEFTITYSYSMIPIRLAFLYMLMKGDPFSIYANGFAGFYMLSYDDSWAMDGEVIDECSDSDSKFGFGGGLGFLYMLSPTMALDIFGNFNHILTEGDATQYVDAGLGLIFFLGGEENGYEYDY
jgi:hypothetical protein